MVPLFYIQERIMVDAVGVGSLSVAKGAGVLMQVCLLLACCVSTRATPHRTAYAKHGARVCGALPDTQHFYSRSALSRVVG